MIKREGLTQTPRTDGKTPILPIPARIVSLPEARKSAAKKPAASTAAAPPTKGKAKAAGAAPSAEVVAKAVEFIDRAVAAAGGSATRQELATAAFKDSDLAKDADKNAIINSLYKPEVAAALVAAGFEVDGDNVSKA
jgi:hypothetical protein